MKVAFVGIGQTYPSHVWMGRMRQMLADRIVVNVDDLRNIDRQTTLVPGTKYVPRKNNRMMRALRSLRLTSQTTQKLRSDWMMRTIADSGASLAFVHFLDYAVQFTDVWEQLQIPVVVHCHGYDVHWDVRHQWKLNQVHGKDYPQQVRNLPDNVWFIANSSFTQNQLLSIGIAKNKIFSKRFGVPLSERPRDHKNDAQPSLLFLGRLVDFKGPLETVQAFANIADKHPSAVFDIAGDGWYSDQIDELASELDMTSRIVRHGVVNQDQGNLLRQNAAIFTAHNQTGQITGQVEAFGVSLLEAMGQGVPVVTGRSGGIPDFVHHQQNGLLFASGDVQSHSDMLDELLRDTGRRAALGEAAWQTVRDNYQSAHEQADMLAIFDQAASIVSSPLLADTTTKAA